MLTSPPTPSSHRDHGADTLRGIAILMVLVLHGSVMTEGLDRYPWLMEAANHLGSGVQLFFVLSGFVITAAMDRARVNGDGTSGFLLRRLAKLMPLYLLFLHLNIAFFWWWSSVEADPQFFRNSVTAASLSVPSYLAHLTFTQGFAPSMLNTLLDGDWSILCEVYFYVLTPLVLHRLTRTMAGALWTLTATLAIASVFAVTIGKQFGVFGYYGLPAQLPCFLMGVAVYRAREQFSIEVPHSVQAALAATLGLFVLGLLRAETAPLGGHVIIALLFALALLLIRVNTQVGMAGVLQWLGRQSYALFLVHLLLLKLAYSMLFSNGFNPGFWPSLAINLVISVGVSILLSWALFDPLDRTCVRAMARYLGRPRAAI